MNIQLIAEIMGTVAFAISGAMLAIERKMDLFGIVFLGIVTAAGGGFIRDMTLGIVPPAMFSSPMVLPLAILSSLAVCALVAWLYKGSDEELHGERFQWILNFTDPSVLDCLRWREPIRPLTVVMGTIMLMCFSWECSRVWAAECSGMCWQGSCLRCSESMYMPVHP